MNFLDWLRWAWRSRGNNLIFFNAKNELRVSGWPGLFAPLAALPTHYADFAGYLRRARHGGYADSLRRFEAARRKMHTGSPAYSGPPILRSREFVGIKALAGFERRREHIAHASKLGLSASNCKSARVAADQLLRSAATRGVLPRDLDDDEKQQVADAIEKWIAPTPIAISPVAAASTPAHADRPKISFAPAASRPSKDYSPIWLTCKISWDAERAALPNTADALQKSGYVAGLRCALGLFSAYDHAPDIIEAHDRYGRAIPPTFRYRCLLTFSATFNASDFPHVTQPNLFSVGFDDLFVSRRTADPARRNAGEDVSGRTVRLVDNRCRHGGRAVDTCARCGTAGLPEVVTPKAVLFDRADVQFLKAYGAFSQDLRRYSKPSCDAIRSKNPY